MGDAAPVRHNPSSPRPFSLLPFSLSPQFRFHTLVWLAGGIPTWLQDEYDAGTLTLERKKHILGEHIKNTTQRYAGNVWAYDVVNEAICDFGYLCYPGWTPLLKTQPRQPVC